jgi:diguanylate cyclase (GGDEF)-like protein
MSVAAAGPLRVWLLSLGLALLAGLTTWGLHIESSPEATGLLFWSALALGFFIAEASVVHVTIGRQAHSFAFSEVPLVLGLFFCSPTALIVVRLVGTSLSLFLVRRQSPVKASFNLAQYWLGAAVAVGIWQVAEPWDDSIAAVCATTASAVVSALCVSWVMRLVGERPTQGVLLRSTTTGIIVAFTNTAFAIVLIDVMRTDWRNLWAVAVLAGFLVQAQRSHVRLQKRHDALQRLNDFTRQVGSNLKVAVTAEDIVSGTSAAMDDVDVSLELVDEPLDDEVLVDADLLAGGATPPRAPWRRPERPAQLETPLVAHGRVVGRLTVAPAAPTRVLGRDDASLLTALGQHAGVAFTNGQLTEELRAQLAENAHQATHDPLTGMANRVLFARAVDERLEQTNELSVLLLDLDRFKDVNDTLGHAAGDALLRDVGERLRAVLPDAACIARLGGDEFAVLLHTGDAREAARMGEMAREALLYPLEVSSVPLCVDASVGVAVAPADGDNCDDLLRRADVAMYVAKDGRGAVEIYRPDIDHNDTGRLSILGDLRRGIEERRLVVYYQPKIELASGIARSVEALVRWDDPVRGLVYPDEFIPLAERTGVINTLTDYVLDRALRQCHEWLEAGLDIGVSVNLSPRVLRDTGFPDRLAAVLRETQVPAARLTLEITESAIMTDIAHTVDMLWRLRRSGVRLSIDDLGVGQSSLAYLKKLPVDEVKIDKSFVFNMADDEQDDAIVCAVVGLAHRLKMSVVAEGVESERARDRLAEIGCDVAQGYLYSRAVTGPALTAWLGAEAQVAARRQLRVAR